MKKQDNVMKSIFSTVISVKRKRCKEYSKYIIWKKLCRVFRKCNENIIYISQNLFCILYSKKKVIIQCLHFSVTVLKMCVIKYRTFPKCNVTTHPVKYYSLELCRKMISLPLKLAS